MIQIDHRLSRVTNHLTDGREVLRVLTGSAIAQRGKDTACCLYEGCVCVAVVASIHAFRIEASYVAGFYDNGVHGKVFACAKGRRDVADE